MLTARFIFALVLTCFASLNATAESPSPVALPATMVDLSNVNLNTRWSYGADLHGGTSAGVGLLVQTPLFWNLVSLRTGVNLESVRLANTSASRLSYTGVPVGIRLNSVQSSSANMYPYIQFNFNFFFISDSELLSSSKTSYELLYGSEWRHRASILGGEQIDQSVFIEAGFGQSVTQLSLANGGQYLGDGFLMRLGLRRFF